MITKMLPDQIAKFWPIVKYAIEQSLPPVVGDHPDRMNRILSAALADKVDVWAIYHYDEEKVVFEGVALTKVLYDDVSGTRNLLLYCLYGYNELSKESWNTGLKALATYAKEKKCSFITAYTEFEGIKAIASKLGADTKYTFISFDVKKIV